MRIVGWLQICRQGFGVVHGGRVGEGGDLEDQRLGQPNRVVGHCGRQAGECGGEQVGGTPSAAGAGGDRGDQRRPRRVGQHTLGPLVCEQVQQGGAPVRARSGRARPSGNGGRGDVGCHPPPQGRGGQVVGQGTLCSDGGEHSGGI